MGLLYAKDGKIYATDYTEIYVPMDYFDDNFAANEGISVKTFGLVYIRAFNNGQPSDIKLLNVPVTIDLMLHDFEYQDISIHDKTIKVMTLKYLKDSYVFRQSIEKGRKVAETFINYILNGKLPKTLDYSQIINYWWKNLEMAGVTFKVPSKIYEIIIASIYRNPHNRKDRYGQIYGKSSPADNYGYATGNVRDVVGGLSTFSGIIFESISEMISSGVNNSLDGEVENVSPLEKIIYY